MSHPIDLNSPPISLLALDLVQPASNSIGKSLFPLDSTSDSFSGSGFVVSTLGDRSSNSPASGSSLSPFSSAPEVLDSDCDTEVCESEEDEELDDTSKAIIAFAGACFKAPGQSPTKTLGSPRRVQASRTHFLSSRGLRIGSGAEATVSATWSPLKTNALVVKLLRNPTEARFCRDKLAEQSIPHIVHIIDSQESKFGLAKGVILMERLELDLSRYMKSHGLLSPSELKRAFRQLLECLSRMPVIHADLKPSNLLVREQKGEILELKVADFGVSQVVGNLSKYIQTTGYRAPEVYFCKQYSKSCDLWSLGCVLFFLVTGESLIHVPAAPRNLLGGFYEEKEPEIDDEYRAEITEIMQVVYHLGGVDRSDLEGYFLKFRRLEFSDKDIQTYFSEVPGGKYMPNFGAFYDARAIEQLTLSWDKRLDAGFDKNPATKEQLVLRKEVKKAFWQLMKLDPSLRAKPEVILRSFFPDEEVCIQVCLDQDWLGNEPVIVSIKPKDSDLPPAKIQMSLLALPKSHIHVPKSDNDSFDISVHDLQGKLLVAGVCSTGGETRSLVLKKSNLGQLSLDMRSKRNPKRKERDLFESVRSSRSPSLLQAVSIPKRLGPVRKRKKSTLVNLKKLPEAVSSTF